MRTLTLAAAGMLIAASGALAAPIGMQGDYINTAIGDRGTLGSGGSTSPGLMHDPTGTRNFGVNDYLTPGTPYETFSVRTNQTGIRANDNDGRFQISTTLLTTVSGSGFDHYVRWEGGVAGAFTVRNDYYFNDGDQQIKMRTTITALQDLTGVSFLRAIDPDPDVNTHGSFATKNQRGVTGVSATDFVGSSGPQTGLTLGLYTTSGVAHNTAVVSGWPFYDPLTALAGGDAGDGDYAIALGFNIGDLGLGESIVLDYSYVMGETIDTTVPPPSDVPEPGTLSVLGLGLAGLLAARRRRRA